MGAPLVGLGARYVSILGPIRLTAGQHPLRAVANPAAATTVLAVIASSDVADDLVTTIAICVIVAVAFVVVLGCWDGSTASLMTRRGRRSWPRCGEPVDAARRHQRRSSRGSAFSIGLAQWCPLRAAGRRPVRSAAFAQRSWSPWR